MTRLLYILVGVILVFLNTYFFSNTQVSHSIYEEVNNHLRFLSHSEEMLRLDVIRARYSLLPNYDSIVTNLYKMRTIVEDYKQGPVSIHALGMDEFIPVLDRLIRAIDNKDEISSDFQESNSILKNSISYFLVTASELIARNSQMVPDNLAYTISLSELTRTLLSYSLSGEKTPPALIQNWINRFEAMKNKLPLGLQADITNLIKHAKIIKEYQGKTDHLLQALLNISIVTDIELLEQAYQQRLEAESEQAGIYRSLLYASSLLLLSYFAVIILRLRNMTARLTQTQCGAANRDCRTHAG
uniref:Two-component signal transduction sensor histidine kinase n=1 Tax=uncultured organism TaxID=155900 RepID=E3T323_9ZZZZ|nr:two-component signal transduction sensor histidine kinase [uncultured organism]